MKERVHLGRWRTPQAEQRFRDMEDVLADELWTEPPTSVTVPTRLGPTVSHRWAGGDEPVVFLHGMGATSLQWAGYVDRIDGRDTWAIETIGDVGRSTQTVPVESPDDLADWLDEVLAGLDIGHAHLVGCS